MLPESYHFLADPCVPRDASATGWDVSGPFYVTDGCTLCCAPEAEAPGLIGYLEDEDDIFSCRFIRQPENAAELAQAVEAMRCSCVECLRYGGTDPIVLAHLRELGLAPLCDAP